MKMSSDFVGGSNCPSEDAFFITRRELVYGAYVKLPARISRAASCRSFQLHHLRLVDGPQHSGRNQQSLLQKVANVFEESASIGAVEWWKIVGMEHRPGTT